MKKIISLVLLYFIVLVVNSQTLINNTIDVTGGYSPSGFGINANYNVIFDNSYVKLGIYVSSNKDKQTKLDVDYEIPYTILSVNVGYFKPFIKNRNESIILSGGLGLLAGYEVINNGNNEFENGAIIENGSSFIYGGFGSLDLEVGITQNIYILANITEFYHVNSYLGKATMYGGLGVRIYIN